MWEEHRHFIEMLETVNFRQIIPSFVLIVILRVAYSVRVLIRGKFVDLDAAPAPCFYVRLGRVLGS